MDTTAWPSHVKLYRNGEARNFRNAWSHTLADDDAPGKETRGVNFIEQALADGWWWTRDGRPKSAELGEPAECDAEGDAEGEV